MSAVSRPDIVLFDLDGTLTDAAPGIMNGMRKVFDHFGIAHPDEGTWRSFLGPPLAVTWREHFNFTDEQIQLGLTIYREYYHDVGMFENRVFDGIPELLHTLKGDGVILATATSKPDVSAERILRHFHLTDFFTFIGAAHLDGSRDTKAQVVGYTLDNLNAHHVTHDVVMVGDRSHDVHGARAHGLDTVGVLWGYGDVDELTSAGVSRLVDSTTALDDALIARNRT